MTNQIYNFHPDTGEFISEGLADESPLEVDVLLIPANATQVAPPARGAGEIALWNGSSWDVVVDKRGLWYSADHQAVKVDQVSADVAGLTRTPPPDDAHDLVDGQWQVNARRAQSFLKEALIAAVQSHMDAAAQARGYDSILSAVSYADELVVPTFQTEGRAYRVWRSRVWQACYQLLAEVQSGRRAAPDEAELLSMLPTLDL